MFYDILIYDKIYMTISKLTSHKLFAHREPTL